MLSSKAWRSPWTARGALALSAAAHAAAGWLLWPRLGPSPAPTERVVEVEIVAAFRPAPRRPRSTEAVAAPTAPRAVTAPPFARSPAAGPAAAPAIAPGRAGQVAFDSPEEDLRRALRSRAGCAPDSELRLTQAEQDACDERLALAARKALPLREPLDPAERAAMERQAADNEAWRRYREEGGEYPGLRKLLRR